MKKILLIFSIIALSFAAKAQPGSLDTVKQNLTMKASEWAYYVSYFNGAKDSAAIAFIRSVRTAAQAIQSPNWNTAITVNNVPGIFIVKIYNISKQMPAGEAVQLGLAGANTISAIANPVLQYYIGQIDSRHQSGFLDHRNLGKNILIDN